VLDNALGAVGEGQFEMHGQPSCTQRQAFWAEQASPGFVATLFGERNGGKSSRIVVTMKVIVDIPGVESRIKGRKTRAEAQTLLGGGHQREEV